MDRFLALVAAALLCGCAAFSGRVPTHHSRIEGEREISVAPGWLYGGGFSTPAKAGGSWSEKSPRDFNLEIVVMGGGDIVGLKIECDGAGTAFTPTDPPTRVFAVNEELQSSRHFVVPLALVRQAVAAKRAVFQIQLADRLVTARLFEQPTYARPALRQMLKEISISTRGRY